MNTRETPTHVPSPRTAKHPPRQLKAHTDVRRGADRHQPWVPASGLVGKARRSARRS
jgi:hypothetical protein